MEFDLPKLGKPALNFPHFPTRWQTFLFRAAEYVPMDKIAKVLGVTEEVARRAAADLGLPDYNPGQLWLTKGYLTIIRRLWHILPYEQLMELLDMDTQALCVLLREEDFFSIKLGSEKPICEKVQWRPLTAEEQQRTAAIKTLMEAMPETKVQPFDFHYELPEIHFSGKEVFETRMIYLFSGLYQTAFDVDSHVYCSDALLEAYQKIGINGVWTVGSFNALAPNPFAPNVSEGWEKRLENARAFAERLEKYGIKLYLYLNEPRHMPEKFYEAYPHLRGHAPMEDAVCMCTSTPEAQAYLTDSVEHICRNIPSLGGFFTITRSENPSNCYSHSSVPGMSDYPLCTCPRCSKRSIGDVISEVIACYREGADRVSKEIRIFAWSWAWNEGIHEDIIGKLPERVIMLSQSERLVPFTIGGVNGEVHDYSMSIIGPGKEAMKQWSSAKARGLQTCAKVQMNTTWEASTVPALPVYQW